MHARRQARLEALPQVGTRTGWWRALPLSRPSRTGVGRMLPAAAQPAALASFSTTRVPVHPPTSSARRAPVQSRLVPWTMVLRSEEVKPAAPMPTVGGVVLGDELVGDRGDGLDDGLAIDGGRVAAHGGQDRALPIDHPVAIVVPPTSSPAG